MRYLSCLLFLAATAYAAPPASSDPPAPQPAPVAPFILPPTPAPEPLPPPIGTPIQLLPGHPFVVRLNAATVLASPEGLVKMKVKAEPLTVVDAEGVDTEYSGDKSVCFVWPVKGAAGPCELLIVPTDGSTIGRVKLMVGNPGPPTPPIPPGPTDPLAATLQAAYAKDADVDKAASLTRLQACYAGMAAAAKSPTLQAKMTTNAAAAAWMKTTMEDPIFGLSAAKLVDMRKAIAADVAAAWGAAPAPLSAASLQTELTKISTALSEVAK